jgi:HEAT repeat protein
MKRRTLVLALSFLPSLALAAPARNPAIAKLAKQAAACKYEGYFDEDCAGYKAWNDEETLFADGKANDTLFSMLSDPDEKIRVLASKKSIDDPKAYFADKGRATQLVALAGKATDAETARTLAGYVCEVDPEKVGLAAPILALAKHPVAEARQQLAGIIERNQGKTAVAIITQLVDDTDKSVRSHAISDLSGGGITPGGPAVCALLSKELSRTDDTAGDALWAGASSKCAGMDKQVITELEKRVAAPTKITNANGVGYALAASRLCSLYSTPEYKPRAFAVAKALSSPKITDPNTRSASLGAISSCGGADAGPVLKALTQDKDARFAKTAAETLARMKK